MGFRFMVRDQEVEGSNRFAPTTLLKSATYKTEESNERLVQCDDVNGSTSFTINHLFSFRSTSYVAFSTTSRSSGYGQQGQHRRVCLGWKWAAENPKLS